MRFTSPRLRGEVGAQRRVRGSLRESNAWIEPLTPALSPQERGEGEEGSAPQAESQRSCQLAEPQRGVLEWLRALAEITVTKICSIGIQTGSSVFTSLTKSA